MSVDAGDHGLAAHLMLSDAAAAVPTLLPGVSPLHSVKINP